MEYEDVKDYINQCRDNYDVLTLKKLNSYISDVINHLGCELDPRCKYKSKCGVLSYCVLKGTEYGDRK